MTILAVVGLAAAVVIVAVGDDTAAELKERIRELAEQVADLRATVRSKDEEIDKLDKENEGLQKQIDALKPPNGGDNDNGDDDDGVGPPPCLRRADGGPKTLLQVFVGTGHFRLEPLADEALKNIPGGAEPETIFGRQLEPAEFEEYAEAMYLDGDAEKTFDGACRFFVELKWETDSCRQVARSRAVVERYFLAANSGEVNTASYECR